ncbi:type I toxin-antitoxin system Ibs family toxin [Scandinavium goeteborgense]|nr:type I toxin-antitoxin system Ibs family toxin [Scandinavium goeteborgense]MCS2154957.1 type I toxin-antitoxin system Ibs family toxin [Scandinavium goeteborgense]
MMKLVIILVVLLVISFATY